MLPRPLTRWIDRTWRTSVAATSEALFPEGCGVPGHAATELVPRTEAYVLALPPSQRPAVMLLFVAVEWLAPVLAPFGGRLSRRSPEERLAIVERWRESPVPIRLLGDALRATLVMVYFSHPAVLAQFDEPLEGECTKEAS
jgi:hypothetical protein